MEPLNQELMMQALQEAQDGGLDSSELARLILGYEEWNLQLEEDGVPLVEKAKEAGETLNIYANRQIAAEDLIYLDRPEEIARLGTLSGSEILSLVPESLSVLRINRGHPSMIYYDKDGLVLLKELAEALFVEDLLAKLARTESVNERRVLLGGILDYHNYWILLEKVGEEHMLLYAPDPEERALAAIFTAKDALRRFITALLEETEDEKEAARLKNEAFFQTRMSGHELFLQLQNQNLDGVLFNPLGPPKPVGFNARFLTFFRPISTS